MGAQWKHKGRTENAVARSQVIGKLVKEVQVAAKAGADPDMNPRLRMAVEAARKASMPKDTLEKAIKKGAGLLDEQVNYELVTYEGFAPHQVPVIVECLTENKTRTASNMRVHFRRGQLGASGTVSWDFRRLGSIGAPPPKADADAEAAAIEAGAQDLEPGEDGATTFLTEPADLDMVAKALGVLGWKVEAMVLVWKAKNPMTLDAEARAQVEKFLADLDEDDDVQTLFVALA